MPLRDLSDHMTTLEFFPNAIQSAFHPEAKRIQQKLLNAIADIRESTPSQRPEDWACNVYTTIESNNELQNRPEFYEVKNFIEEELKYFSEIHKIYLPQGSVFIKDMWINIYNKNCSMDIHHHPNSLFTGVYFIKLPDNGAQFAFDSPSTQEMIHAPVKMSNEYNMKNASFIASEGELIVFNSHIKHRVFLHNIDEERITLSFTAVI